ncbi:sigma-70 family RNA polymerase sigma factor [Alcanivoracaceae bacterium MT1]
MAQGKAAGTRLRKQLGTLYVDHHGWLSSWLQARLGCSHTAADLAQDTYVRLLVRGYLPEPEQSRRHLRRIASGLMIDHHRRRRIEAAYRDALSALPEPEVPSEETRAEVIDTLVRIDALLHKLPAKPRRAFLLSRLDGLSYPQIAQRLDVSVSSVEKYIARALEACFIAALELRP